VLVPAILAQAEVSNSSGAEMLAAYLAGYEVWAELIGREAGALHEKGWHPTAVLGAIAPWPRPPRCPPDWCRISAP